MDTTPRLSIPQLREAPPDVVRQLREILPSAELFYLGDGKWALGNVERTRHREASGIAQLARAMRAKITKWTPPSVLAHYRIAAFEGELLRQGFAPIHVFEREPDSSFVEFLREREYNWWRDYEAALRRVAKSDEELDAEEEAEEQAALDRYYDPKKLHEAYRWGYKRPVSQVVNRSAPVDTRSSARTVHRRIA